MVRALGLLTERGDMQSAEGRALERRRRVLLSALSAGGAKAVSLISLLLTVPLSLAYLGPERYGLWMAITGMLAVLSFADLGLGYGLVNALSTAEGLSDPEGSRSAVSSAFYMLAGIGTLLGLGLFLAWPHLHWGEWLNARSPATRQETGAAMAVFSACFVLGLPLSVVTHGFSGLQQGFRSSLYQAVGSLFSLGGILAALKAGAGLPWLVLAASGAPLLAGLLGGCDLIPAPQARPQASPGPRVPQGRAGPCAPGRALLRDPGRSGGRIPI
jgi:O-antigen/teichoic acid export membrane protein